MSDKKEKLENIVDKRARDRVVEAGRLKAWKKGLRRPWDGHHGRDFNHWKSTKVLASENLKLEKNAVKT